MEIIEAATNPFGGVIPKPAAISGHPAEFKSQLEYSLSAWAQERYKVVWLEIPIAKAALVPVATDAGFVFHHAREDYVMMTLQLMEGSYIPPYASHYIGAGGVVVNKSDEILVVSELHRRRGRGPAYKLPGGALLPGEHLADGVVREVLEETGVHSRFESLVCFRHWHGYRYDKSDIYFVCRLSPLSEEITKQDEEIAECLWMPVEQYLGDEAVSQFNKRIVRAALYTPGVIPSQVDGYDDESKYEFFMPQENI